MRRLRRGTGSGINLGSKGPETWKQKEVNERTERLRVEGARRTFSVVVRLQDSGSPTGHNYETRV